MSRTTRNTRWPNSEVSEVSYINKELCYELCRSVRFTWVQKTADEIKFEKEAAYKEYVEAVSKNGGKTTKHLYDRRTHTMYNELIEVREVSNSKRGYVDYIPNIQAATKKAKEEYKAFTRDGTFAQSGTRKLFKSDCARTNRRNNKRYCQKIVTDTWEDKVYPDYRDTNHKIWCWW
jgi:hypothetical protein